MSRNDDLKILEFENLKMKQLNITQLSIIKKNKSFHIPNHSVHHEYRIIHINLFITNGLTLDFYFIVW